MTFALSMGLLTRYLLIAIIFLMREIGTELATIRLKLLTEACNALGEKIRDSYHAADTDLICITAGKIRLIQIYTDIIAGYKLDKRGRRIA